MGLCVFVLVQTSLLRTFFTRAFLWWWWNGQHGIKSEGLGSHLRAGWRDVTRFKNLLSLSFLPQLYPERKRRKQEKMVARQARREQLKRLHRAQVLPCCSISHSCTFKYRSGPQRLTVTGSLPFTLSDACSVAPLGWKSPSLEWKSDIAAAGYN